MSAKTSRRIPPTYPPTRNPVTAQEAELTLSRVAADARAVATVLSAFLDQSAIPDAVAVSVSLRAARLLQEATEHLDTAVSRLEGA